MFPSSFLILPPRYSVVIVTSGVVGLTGAASELSCRTVNVSKTEAFTVAVFGARAAGSVTCVPPSLQMTTTEVYASTTAPNPPSSCFQVPSEHLDWIRFILKVLQVVSSLTKQRHLVDTRLLLRTSAVCGSASRAAERNYFVFKQQKKKSS